MDANLWCYLVQFLGGVVFALVCQFLIGPGFEESGHTWVAATIGIAQVGLIVAARLALAPVPSLAGAEMAWWAWWLVFWSFLASAIPIWAWRIFLQSRNTKHLVDFASRRRMRGDS